MIKNEENCTSIAKYKPDIESLKKVLLLLEPYLLVKELETKIQKSSYKIEKEQFDLNYLARKNELKQAIESMHKKGKESNITILDRLIL